MSLNINHLDTRELKGCPVAVFDIESTGIDTAEARICQISVVSTKLGLSSPSVSVSLLINPQVPIPEEASGIHDIYDEDVAGALTFAEAWPQIEAAIKDHLLAAYNLPYDLAVLLAELDRAGIEHSLSPIGICGYVMAKEVDKFEKGKKLSQVAERRDIRLLAHDAQEDAVATAKLLPILLREIGRGVVREDRYGKKKRAGPWCHPADLQTVAAFIRWTVGVGMRQEHELGEYFAKVGKGPVEKRWLAINAKIDQR